MVSDDEEVCPDCGHPIDGHDLRAADDCVGCDDCIAALNVEGDPTRNGAFG